MKSITIGDISKLRERYDILNTVKFASLANALQNIPDNCFKTQLDIVKFYNHLKSFKGIKFSFNEFKDTLVQMSVILNFSDKLKLSKEERKLINFEVKFNNGSLDLSMIDKYEIDEPILDSDIIIRSADGSTYPAFYRLPESIEEYKISTLKAHYAEKYGDLNKTSYENFLMARPITKGFADEHERSYTRTYTD